MMRLILSLILIVAALSDGTPAVLAASAASKNKEGNRLFEQKHYREAEKAYMAAHAESPDQPEPLYNLGNSLIKQKKYDQALEFLRRAAGKEQRDIQQMSLFNIGNAFFEMGNFKDAANAFAQALMIDPADRDAKHNLELALRRLNDQERSRTGQGENDRRRKPGESSLNGGAVPDKEDQARKEQQPQNAPQQQRREVPPSGGTGRQEESLGREQALQLLDAIKNEEIREQRRLLERRVRRKALGKDW